MRLNRGLRVVVCGLWVAGSGCTALREIPRGTYAALPERDHVRVETRDGLIYEFDYAQFGPDSLMGFRRRDVETPADEYAALGLPLDQVTRLSARGIDWTRTGLVGGGVLLVVLVAAFSNNNKNQGGSGGNSGGGTRPPPQ